MIGVTVKLYTWPRPYQFVIFVSRLLDAALPIHLHLVKSGLDYNFGQKHPRLRFLSTTRMFVLWFKNSNLGITMTISIIVQTYSDACFVYQGCLYISVHHYKHRLKIGKPGFPVAAAKRGKRVSVRAGTTLEVGDRDFTKYSIIAS